MLTSPSQILTPPHTSSTLMSDQLFFRNIPAVHFPFVECDLDQLNHLSSLVVTLSELLHQAKRAVTCLHSLQTRVHNNQVVRCTPNSVKATAAARYSPNSDGPDLSSITINSFVGLVTFLPLPDIKFLANNPAALHKADCFFQGQEVSAKWGTYYTQLVLCNPEWAKRFLDDIQQNLKIANSAVDSLHDTSEQYAVTDLPSARTVQHFNTLAPLNNLQSDSEISSDTSWIPTQLNPPLGTIISHQEQPPNDLSDNQTVQDIQLHLRVLKAKENSWGPENITTLDTVDTIAGLYAAQGQLKDAEAMYVRALTGYDRVLGASHEKTVKASQELQRLHSVLFIRGIHDS